ncbi:MAG: hypothetical protein V1755_06630 [Chloroflexota bacterium]
MSDERLEDLIQLYGLYGGELAHHILDELVELLLEEREEIRREVVEYVHEGLEFNWTEAVIIIRAWHEKAGALDAAGLDVSPCVVCSRPVACIPDGLTMCEECVKNQAGEQEDADQE